MSDAKPRYKTYDHPTGGWGAAAATAKVLMQQCVITKITRVSGTPAAKSIPVRVVAG